MSPNKRTQLHDRIAFGLNVSCFRGDRITSHHVTACPQHSQTANELRLHREPAIKLNKQ